MMLLPLTSSVPVIYLLCAVMGCGYTILGTIPNSLVTLYHYQPQVMRLDRLTGEDETAVDILGRVLVLIFFSVRKRIKYTANKALSCFITVSNSYKSIQKHYIPLVFISPEPLSRYKK